MESVQANLVDIIAREIRWSEVLYEDGRITRIKKLGDERPGAHYLIPGFVDAHAHIESSMLVPDEFAFAALEQGTLASVSDPHEIANVLGVRGIDFMRERAALTPFPILFGAPSCVPATPFESAGAKLTQADIQQLLSSGRDGIPNVDVKAVSCRTHHPSNTAFRGFGAPQAIFTLECALDHLSQTLQMPRWQLQQRNLLQPGYRFDYGMTVTTAALQECWDRLWQHRNLAHRFAAVAQHNQQAPRFRKGLAITPLCFGIAFTATHLNQASVNVNIYQDGSIGIACSAVEMGQGVSEKIRAIVARCFELSLDHIRVDYTNSSKTPNMSATAASVGSDLSGMAALQACTTIKQRLLEFAAAHWQQDVALLCWDNAKCLLADGSIIDWHTLITTAYLQRISLAEHAYHATPDLYFDRTREQGHPFAYHVFGVSAIEVTVDCLLGTYTVDQVDVVYDLGQSLDNNVDRGQMEGGLVQGIGYSTLEEIRWDAQGHVLTDRFATYKIPDLLSAPRIQVDFIASASNPHGPFSAKAIGEPPFLLGLGVYFALADAMRSFNPAAQLDYQLPLTPERVLLGLYPDALV